MFSSIPLGMNDLVNAAFWAIVIVIIIRLLGWGMTMLITRSRWITFDPNKLEEVRKQCSRVFPIENLNFDGMTFKRGTFIRIITHQQAAIEGEFLGTNFHNMLCLVTREIIVTQELNSIETIQAITKPSSGRVA